jgi:hypothetical protein
MYRFTPRDTDRQDSSQILVGSEIVDANLIRIRDRRDERRPLIWQIRRVATTAVRSLCLRSAIEIELAEEREAGPSGEEGGWPDWTRWVLPTPACFACEIHWDWELDLGQRSIEEKGLEERRLTWWTWSGNWCHPAIVRVTTCATKKKEPLFMRWASWFWGICSVQSFYPW